MKFGTVRIHDREVLIAAVGAEHAVEVAAACRAAGMDRPPAALAELTGLQAAAMAQVRAAVTAAAERPEALLDVETLSWLPPQPRPSKILGVAFNNMGIRRAAHVDPGVPNFFLKAPSCLTGHRCPILIRQHYGETIPEPELAAVIGTRCQDIAPERALAAVFGYTIVNDITSHGLKFGMDSIATAREPDLLRPHHFGWRRRHGEEDRDVYYVYHTRSKASDTFGPMGPWITTADEVADPNALAVTARVDGEVFGVDNTSSYRFRIEEVIAEASRYFTLEPGDVICFGTSAKGVAAFPAAHRSVNLHARGGTIDIDIDGLGRLSNPVHRDWIDGAIDSRLRAPATG